MASSHLAAACSSEDQPSATPGPWLTAGLAVAAGLAALAAAEYLARRTAGPRRGGPQLQGRLTWLHLLGVSSDASDAQRRTPQAEQQGGGGADQLRGGEHAEQAVLAGAGELLEVEGQEVPEEFICPITFSVMDDPVCLCGTGQVYNYASLRAWLCTGQRKCPKTNMALVDLEVVRLPLLRHAVHGWLREHGLPVPQQGASREVLTTADPRYPDWVADLRCGDVSKRGIQAAAKINDALIEWGQDTQAGEEVKRSRAAAMEHVVDDLVWLLRHGDCYGQGVACAALSQYAEEEQRQWLAAVATIPAVQLLISPNDYARHSAARLLAVLTRVHPNVMPAVLCDAGAVPGLLAQLDLRRPFPYTRCSAASALCGIAAATEGNCKEAIRMGGGVELLLSLVLQDESRAEQGLGPHNEQLVRFDKRDAAAALLQLGVTEQEVAGVGLTLAQLWAFKNCSHAYLYGRVSAPDSGYTPAELAQVQVQQGAARQQWGTDAQGGEDAGAQPPAG